MIDWCAQIRGTFKKYSYEQIIKIENTIDPILTVGADTVVCTYDTRCIAGFIELRANATDDCTDSTDLQWRYEIDEGRDGSVDHVGFGLDASDEYDVGIYTIKWIVEDRCGNKVSEEQDFEIRNCKAPTAYCINGLSAEITPNGNGGQDVTVWAKDFDAGSSHVCPDVDVFISFSADTSNRFRTYDCDSVGQRTVEIWVTDEFGNTSKCITYILITDSLDQGECNKPDQ